MSSRLAIHGGPRAVQTNVGDIFDWPIITEQDERAVLEVLRARKMSKLDVTLQFEDEVAAFHGTRFALGLNNGTASVHSAMFGCGVGVGDEVICQSPVIWASAIPAFSLGATVVFADIDPETLTLDPEDVERKITERTRAIVAVHYFGYPANMDAIVAIAARHDIKVIEDLSHAHGGRYRGKKVGAIGDVAAMSVMSEKGLAIGEGGLRVTNDREIYDRAVAFGHYERTGWMSDLVAHQIESPVSTEIGTGTSGRTQLPDAPAVSGSRANPARAFRTANGTDPALDEPLLGFARGRARTEGSPATVGLWQ